jgi:hypothetical protein
VTHACHRSPRDPDTGEHGEPLTVVRVSTLSQDCVRSTSAIDLDDSTLGHASSDTDMPSVGAPASEGTQLEPSHGASDVASEGEAEAKADGGRSASLAETVRRWRPAPRRHGRPAPRRHARRVAL